MVPQPQKRPRGAKKPAAKGPAAKKATPARKKAARKKAVASKPAGGSSAPRKPARPRLTKEQEEKFIAALRTTRDIDQACMAIKPSRMTVYRHKKESDDFRAAWDRAYEANVDDLEAKAMKIAIEGTTEPVVHKGEVIGARRVYHQGLMIFLLKTRRRKVYSQSPWDHDTGTRDSLGGNPQEVAANLANILGAMRSTVPPPPPASAEKESWDGEGGSWDAGTNGHHNGNGASNGAPNKEKA